MMNNTLYGALLGVILFVMTACSSQNNGNQDKLYNFNSKRTGYFIDSGVSGLEYSTNGVVYDTTQSGGAYQYFYNDIVTFKIGNISLGSAYGGSTITPKDLAIYKKIREFNGAQNSVNLQDFNITIEDNEVLNRTRFLLHLDSNTSQVGIQISEQTREDAKSWVQLDFSLSDSDFTNDVISKTSITDFNNTTRQEALTHLSNSLRCTYSGAYRGNWILPNGSRSGFVGVLIQSNGTIVALGDGQEVGENSDVVIYSTGEHNMSTGKYSFTNNTYYFNPNTGQIEPQPTDINGSGGSIGYDKVAGTFSQTIAGELQQGTYEAYRVAKGIQTVYRFTGFGYTQTGQIIGIFTLDLQADGNVVGMIHDARNDKQPSIEGSVDYQTGQINVRIDTTPAIIMTNQQGTTITSNFPDINLTWQYEDGSDSGYATGVGCQLQEPQSN